MGREHVDGQAGPPAPRQALPCTPKFPERTPGPAILPTWPLRPWPHLAQLHIPPDHSGHTASAGPATGPTWQLRAWPTPPLALPLNSDPRATGQKDIRQRGSQASATSKARARKSLLSVRCYVDVDTYTCHAIPCMNYSILCRN